MNKILVWVSVLLVVIFGGRALVNHMSSSANENAATQRVKGFLSGMTTGGDFQNAFNMWMTGANGAIQNMSQEQYNVEVASLNAWMAKRGLGQRIQSFEMVSARMVVAPQGADPSAVEVSCTINGKPATILTIKNERLEWVD